MNKFDEFKNWIEENTTYTKRTKSNIVSRLKRADIILPISEDSMYIFKLSQEPKFLSLTVSVKSQIRRAAKLYFQFIGNEEEK